LYALLVVISCGQVYFSIYIPDKISHVINLAEEFNNPDIPNPTSMQIFTDCALLVTYVVALVGITVVSSFLSNKLAAKYAFYIRHEIFVKVNKLSLEKINKLTISSII
jgi:ABC-type multidrug transport system fused ATPase/permease subunit